IGHERVEAPCLAGAVAVHDDDLRRPSRAGAAHRRVDLLGVQTAALLVHRIAARRLLPLDDSGHALHVADHEDLHRNATSPTSSFRLFSTGTLANSAKSGKNAASAGESARCAPSSTLSANPAPSAEAPHRSPSAPPFATHPTAARISRVSSESAPPINCG